MKVVDFDVCQNAPKLTGYHSNVPYATTKFYASSVIPIHVTTYAERLTMIGLVVTEISGRICIFAVSSNKVQLLPSQSLGLLDRMSPKLCTM